MNGNDFTAEPLDLESAFAESFRRYVYFPGVEEVIQRRGKMGLEHQGRTKPLGLSLLNYQLGHVLRGGSPVTAAVLGITVDVLDSGAWPSFLVAALRVKDCLTFICPFCRQQHFHAPTGQLPFHGNRARHCLVENYANRYGYDLFEVDAPWLAGELPRRCRRGVDRPQDSAGITH